MGRKFCGVEESEQGGGFRGREADEVTLEDPVQVDGDSKSESRVIEGFLTGGHNTKPLSCGKESECHQWKDKEEWSWAGSQEMVKVETTRQTETSGQVENAMDVQRGMTDGQSIRPLVDHRPPWKIHWQKHSELQGKEVERILKQRTLEPDEDPEKMSCHLWKTP